MPLALVGFGSALVLLFAGLVGSASADPVNSPNISFGTIACGGVTYTLVAPLHGPEALAVTANGSNSTSVSLVIVDKAGANFPQNLLTLCTAFPPPPDEPFQAYFLITPLR